MVVLRLIIVPSFFVTSIDEVTLILYCIVLPALIVWDKGGNVTSADPIWHVSSYSSEACCELLYPIILLCFYLLHCFWVLAFEDWH